MSTGERPSDFRSDTVTRPCAAMRAAMASAEVGDDVLDRDPTVRRLERWVADWLGKEDALFVPSGTMANQVSVGAWTQPGDEIVVQRWAHVTTFEAGAVGALHGVQALTVGGDDGALDAESVRAALRPASIHCPRTALVCFEQTHNLAGGRVAPLDELEAVAAVARGAGVPLHLDGARLANAVVASGVPARRWAAAASSVAVCLSKGLGAPVGSLVAGERDFLERVARLRKRFGGWMRQAGVLAAAGLWALEHNLERLARDHELARDLARRVAGRPGLVAPERVDTNIVMVDVRSDRLDAAALASALGEHGVLVFAMGSRLRFVTHLDLEARDLDRLERALDAVLGG